MSNLYNKYTITKTDGSPVDPEAQYFVLRIDTDVAARYAVLHYASYIGGRDPEFADDLRKWIMGRRFWICPLDHNSLSRCGVDVCPECQEATRM